MKIINKDGFFSAYGFLCGYVERRETDNVSLEMWLEHGMYHVRHLNYAYERTDWNESPHYQWMSFEKIKEAKKCFFNLCNKLNFKKIRQ